MAAVGPQVPILEYHYQASASPDGRRIAAAIGSPQIGSVRIIDTSTLEFVTTKAGIAAEAVEWLDNDRVTAALACVPTNPGNRGRCQSLVLIDANSGAITRRWPENANDADQLLYEPPLERPKPAAITKFGVAFLLGHVNMTTAAMLAIVTPEETVHWVPIGRIEIGLYGQPDPVRRSWGPRTSAGLTARPGSDRVYVVGAESLVAEVDLKTLSITYHEITGMPPLNGVFRRRVAWFGDRYLAVSGEALSTEVGGDSIPDGVRMIDTSTWQSSTIEPRAARAVVSGGWMVAYGGTLRGIVGISDTGARWELSATEQEVIGNVTSLYPIGNRLFVASRDNESRSYVHAIDLETGKLLNTAVTEDLLIDLVSTTPR